MERCIHKVSHEDRHSASDVEYWNPHLFHSLKLAKQTQNICSSTDEVKSKYGLKHFANPAWISKFRFVVCKNSCGDGGQNYPVLNLRTVNAPNTLLIRMFLSCSSKLSFVAFKMQSACFSREVTDKRWRTHRLQLPTGWKEHNVSMSNLPKFNSPGKKTFKYYPLVVN